MKRKFSPKYQTKCSCNTCLGHEFMREETQGSAAQSDTGKVICGTHSRGLEMTLFPAVMHTYWEWDTIPSMRSRNKTEQYASKK